MLIIIRLIKYNNYINIKKMPTINIIIKKRYAKYKK